MFFVHLYRIIKFALQNFWRNLWLSVVTITIIVLSLFSVTLVMGINAASQAAVATVESRIDVSVFFNPGVVQEQVLDMRGQVASIDQVAEVELVPADQALARFSARHLDDQLIQETLRELDDNPFGPVLIIKAQDSADYAGIVSQIAGLDSGGLIEEIDFQDREVLIQKIDKASARVSLGAIILSGAFLLISVLVVFNTIRLGIYAQREEVGIMKLVGASNLYTRSPFLFEGFVYALFSVGIFWLAQLALLAWINPGLKPLLSGIGFDAHGYLTSNFLRFFIWQLVILTVLNTFSSWIAIRKYLKI